MYCTLIKPDHLEYSRKLIRVPDRDSTELNGTIGIDFTPPITSDNPLDQKTPILVVIHGLTGGSHETYVINILKPLTKPKSEGGLGWRGCVINFRGCAGVKLTSSQLYSGAYTDDLRRGLAYISTVAPDAPLYGIGFSLGANVLAKYLGEEGDQTPLKAGLVLGCPFEFLKGHHLLCSSFLGWVYSRAMASNLKRLITNNYDTPLRYSQAVDWDAFWSNPNQTLYEFDTLVTSKMGGYTSAEEYYRNATSTQYLAGVRVPTLMLSSANDPIVGGMDVVPIHKAKENPYLAFAVTPHGGHLGWFEGLLPRRWIDKPVLEFLDAIHKHHSAPKPHLPLVELKDKIHVEGREHIAFKEVEGAEMIDGMDTEGLVTGL